MGMDDCGISGFRYKELLSHLGHLIRKQVAQKLRF